MILTNCAACAAPLAHTAPRCVRCQTRYCNKTCQHNYTLRVRTLYAVALYMDSGATLDDLREAVNMLEDVERTARRVLGGAHPDVVRIELALRESRAALDERLSLGADHKNNC